MENTNIIRVNTTLFFCGWTTIMLAGADFPPPIGFLWLMLMVTVLDCVQYIYLQKFIPQLRERKKNLFAKNFLSFTIGGMIVSLLFLAVRYKTTLEMSIADIIAWIAVLTIIGAIYGVCFWFFNKLLLNVFKM